MGNVQGQTANTLEKGKNLGQVINFIASHYILTQSFSDLELLKESEYCDKLIIITSDVLNKYLTKTDVSFLAQKIKNGVDVNEMGKDELLYLRKDDLSKIDVKNAITKKRMCIGIAKYYIKIAHIFGAILTTINPIYTYKDEYGTHHTVSFSEKDNIPKGADIKINKKNICSERVNALVNGQNIFSTDNHEPIKLKPNFCQMNINKSQTERQGKLVERMLVDEPGITQLERLYYDVYDYQTGKFTGMSDAMREEYKKDLAVLYKSFTGEDTVPESIQKFSQIPLRKFHSLSGCQAEPNNQYMLKYEGSPKEKLFVDYANHVREMMETATKDKNALISILDNLFEFAVNPQTKKAEITVSKTLTDEKLNDLVKETQRLVINLYVTCEENFIKGLEIFEQIIQEQLKQQMERKIQALKKGIMPIGDLSVA
jgi:hypothetical protein